MLRSAIFFCDVKRVKRFTKTPNRMLRVILMRRAFNQRDERYTALRRNFVSHWIAIVLVLPQRLSR